MVEINVLIDTLVTTLERAKGFPMLLVLSLMVIVNMGRLNIKSYLGMLMSSFMMLLTTFIVRLKMESLSGFTDLVVSITNTKGGFTT